MEQLLASFKIAPHLYSAVSTCSDRYVPSTFVACLPVPQVVCVNILTNTIHPFVCWVLVKETHLNHI